MCGWGDGPVHEAFVWKYEDWSLDPQHRQFEKRKQEKKSGHAGYPSPQEAQTEHAQGKLLSQPD